MLFAPLIPLLAWLTLAAAVFDLNTQGLDWSFTSSKLAPSTSSKCKAAYSATIDCAYTLVGLVATERGKYFAPTAADLDATLTPECKRSLDAYTARLESDCSAPSDGMPVDADYPDASVVPVPVTGYIFQYQYAFAKLKASDGTYCWLEDTGYAGSDFSCADDCTAGYFQTAHDEKGYGYRFAKGYVPITQSDWWIAEYEKGWERLKACGKAVGDEKEAAWKGLLRSNGHPLKGNGTSASVSSGSSPTTRSSTASATTSGVEIGRAHV